MSFTGFFLNNKHGVWALVIAAILMGLTAYQKIPVRLFPDTAPPLVNVVTSWPGATASDVDRDLTTILETEFASLEGVSQTTTTSQDNMSIVQIEFQYGTDVRIAAVDVQNAISRIGADFPEGSTQPRVMTFSTSDRPVYTVGIAATDMLVARRIAEDVIAPKVQSASGVAAVDVFGGRIPTLIVDVDPKLSEAYHIPLIQVSKTIRASNLSMPAGRLRSDTTETMLRVDQRAKRVEDLADLSLPLPTGDQIRLGTIAEVKRDATQDDALFRINGKRAIAIQVYRTEDANTVDVVRSVQKLITGLEKDLPNIEFIAGEESASFTEQSVSSLLSNVWQALLLASLILFFFLGRARAALVTAFTMPLAFGISFATMWLVGMEFNMVTLSAVILAVGMVVDASVVVLENIIRLRDEGKSAVEAAREGTDQVLMPVLAGVATTLMVLIPLMALPGFIGRVFGPLALTLIIAFSSSVIVALIVVPILTLYIKDGGKIESVAKVIARPFQVSMDYLKAGYIHLLKFGLRHRAAVVLVALLTFGGGIFGLLSGGMNLLPRMDGGAFTISLESASSTPLLVTDKAVRQVEDMLKKHPEVVLVQSQIGFEPGMKFAGGSGVMGSTQGFLSVTLSPRTERERSIWDIEKDLREEINTIPGIVNVVIKEIGNTAKPTTLAPVVARITGPDLRVLDALAEDVLKSLNTVDSIVEPVRAWRRDMKRIVIDVDKTQATSIGQTPQSIGRMLVMGAEGIDSGTWTSPSGTPEDIEVRYSQSKSDDESAMLSWPIFLKNGDVIPIRSLASTRTITEQGLYTSINLNPVLDVRAQVSGRPLNFVVADAKAAISELKVPEGYKITIEGENNDLEESRNSILQALLLSIMAVYLLLVAQFHSWKHPVTVMMAVPLSISGVALALFVVSKPVSMPVMVGLVLLVGTVVNNSILLVDLIRQRRQKGATRQEALIDAVDSRFRPIMMTSMSTVIGMLPLAMELALGSERFSPLAIAVIGGMLVSTLLTLVVIPILYDLADGLRLPGKKIATLATLVFLVIPTNLSAQNSTLEDAWKGVQSHPAIAASSLKIEAAKAQTKSATARLLPSIELLGRATYLSEVDPALIKLPIKKPDGSVADPVQLGEVVQEQYSLGFVFTQPLFVGGAFQGRAAALAGEDFAEATREVTKNDLWIGFIKAWYGVSVAHKLVELQTDVVDSIKLREQSLKRLVEGGRATKLQLLSLSLKRAEAEQNLAGAQSTAINADFALSSLTGKDVLTQGNIDIVKLANLALNVEVGKSSSPNIRQAQARVRAADALAHAKKGALLPTLALRIGGQYSNPNQRYFPVKEEWNSSWDASLVFSWKIDSGAKWFEAKKASLEAAAANTNVDALRQKNELQIKQIATTLKLGKVKLRVADERVQVAKEALKTAENALKNGRTTSLEVVDRQRDLVFAKAAEQKVALEILILSENARALSGKYGPSK